MEYNPFTERCSAMQRKIQSMEDEVRECSRQLAWYSIFNPDTEAETLAACKFESERIQSKIVGLKEKRASEAALAEDLSRIAKLGLDPRRWFSAERIQHAKQRDETRERLTQLNKVIDEQEIEAEKVLRSHQQRQAQLEKHSAIDPLELKSDLNALNSHLEQLRIEFANTLSDKQRVDALLSPMILEQRNLTIHLQSLQREVKLAESFDQRLSHASNGYEKKLVHDECSKTFDGEGRPGRVKQQKQREMLTTRRNLEKVEARLKQLVQLASRTISTLVIDGNNLCYEGGEFIGLDPLYAITNALAEDFRVIVVFDASIRKLLRMNDQQVAHGFPREVMVHVVASKQAADQTVLETASASDAYVISNDRFRDFADKAAVSDQRLIRHEIVAGKVLIHDLNLAVPFEREPPTPGDYRAI